MACTSFCKCQSWADEKNMNTRWLIALPVNDSDTDIFAEYFSHPFHMSGIGFIIPVNDEKPIAPVNMKYFIHYTPTLPTKKAFYYTVRKGETVYVPKMGPPSVKNIIEPYLDFPKLRPVTRSNADAHLYTEEGFLYLVFKEREFQQNWKMHLDFWHAKYEQLDLYGNVFRVSVIDPKALNYMRGYYYMYDYRKLDLQELTILRAKFKKVKM